MKKILHRLQESYGQPVDVEFAWDQGKLYLLQCRTLAVAGELEQVELPENISDETILFTNSRIVSSSVIKDIEYLVYVDPRAYSQLPTYEEKITIGRDDSCGLALAEDHVSREHCQIIHRDGKYF